MNKAQKSDGLKAIPLGGHGEVGKNSWLFEYKDEIVIVNFGMLMPAHSQAGIDLVLPNTSYLQENESKIKGLVLTSSHDDSCGGVFYLLNKIKIPKIYAGKLALKTIEIENKNGLKLPEMEELISRNEITIGENFKIKPIPSTFCVPDTYGLSIKTPEGNIIYTGSFKIDATPVDGIKFDYFSFAEAGEEGVDLLISESSEVESHGYSPKEGRIVKRFNEILRDSVSRIIITCSGCEIHKFQLIFNIAYRHKKKIFISGNHLKNKIKAAIDSGFLKIDSQIFFDLKELENTKDREILVLTSGKYGDYLNALMDLANEVHEIKLKPNDTIVISANPISGSTRILAHTIDQLYIQKVQVIGGRGQGVHISPHAYQEELKFILSVTKPRAFVPSHGEERQLVIHGKIAETMGTNHNDVHILKNGEVVELREKFARIAGKIPAGSIFYNLAKGLDIDEVTMKERETLSEEGTITVALTIDKDKNIVAGPEIFAEACSFAKGKDWRAFCLGTVELIKQSVKESQALGDKEISDIKTIIRDTVNKFIIELVGKRPLVNVAIQEIDKEFASK